MPRRALREAAQHTVDLDIKNCVICLCHQLVSRLQFADSPIFAKELALLSRS